MKTVDKIMFTMVLVAEIIPLIEDIDREDFILYSTPGFEKEVNDILRDLGIDNKNRNYVEIGEFLDYEEEYINYLADDIWYHT